MKKYLNLALILISVIFLKFTTTFILNEIIIKNYESGDYSENLISLLFPLNFEEPYLVHYNSGNLKYQNKDFSSAIEKYETSLKNRPPVEKVCDVRINLSLSKVALVKTTDLNAYEKLEDAKKVLYEDSCANKNDDNGRSKEAEKLKQEITNLQNSLNPNPDNPPNPDTPPEDPNGETPPPNLQQQLQSIQQQGHSEHEGEIQYYQTGIDFSYHGPSW